MSQLRHALVTPSYWKDVEQCRFQLETAQQWVPSDIKHYLLIANRDLPLFRPMISRNVELIVVEDIIPKWLFRVPGINRFWLSLRTLPVKNWILQQIVKLSAPAAIQEDVLLYADSDMFFIAPFDPRSFEREGKVPLFLEAGQRGLIPANDQWITTCSRLLGIPVDDTDLDVNYIGQLIWWRRQNALDAVQRVEQCMGRQWQQVVAGLSGFAEYILYGLYNQRILKERSGHWEDSALRTLNHWGTNPLSLPELQAFSASRQPQHHSAMISSKSNTSMADIRRVFG